MPSARRSNPQEAGGIDSDYAWLKTHLNFSAALVARKKLVKKVASNLRHRIAEGGLPYTLGVFGGWGTGKTTFLAMLADELEKDTACKVVYFNSWKYAGFMEIVPALIYKILQYGAVGTEAETDEAARRVLLALGKKYSDQVGEWAQKKIGVNPIELFKDLYDLPDNIDRASSETAPQVIRAYYTQVDRAQDELRKALGTVTSGAAPRKTVIVLIDELDRCDPDEAFLVIKQMRVLFGMRDLPVAFIVCANPDPIGLAIKHRYGLDSESADYEARRILEKFVDSYEDMSAPESLGPLVEKLWNVADLPWIIRFDDANRKLDYDEDVVTNATALDVITTAVPLFSNIRVLHKSFEYVRDNVEVNRHLLWTQWFLEMTTQIDPRFRRELRVLARTLQDVASAAYRGLGTIAYAVRDDGGKRSLEFATDKGRTVFSIFRSLFWERAKGELARLEASQDPEDAFRAKSLRNLLSDPLRVDFVTLVSLLQFENAPDLTELAEGPGKGMLPKLDEDIAQVADEFGNVLAS
jgi:KAP family P-loop domain